MIKKVLILITILIIAFFALKGLKKSNLNSTYTIGQKIDSLNNVIVFYNGAVDNVLKRNTKNGYNLGLQYQCVEFVKRYYYEHYQHEMPDSYGHAKSFYIKGLSDGETNKQRALIQYRNPSKWMPESGDLVVMKGTIFNKYGHVAIISKATPTEIEIIQQNPGPFASSRAVLKLSKDKDDKWKIANNRILGWLRKNN